MAVTSGVNCNLMGLPSESAPAGEITGKHLIQRHQAPVAI